jgi:hypothetical protein
LVKAEIKLAGLVEERFGWRSQGLGTTEAKAGPR